MLEVIEFSLIPFPRIATVGLIDKSSAQRMDRTHPEQAANLHDFGTAQEEVQSALWTVGSDLARQGPDTQQAVLSQSDSA